MKKILFLIFIALLLFTSCGEEELVLSGEAENEVVTDDITNESNGCDNSSNEIAISNEILDLVNNHRLNIGKSILEFSCIATQLAIEHTEYMIAQDRISHDGFNSRFQELQQQANAKSAGENVASGYTNAESVMTAWLNSDGHRSNIEGDYSHIGISVVKNTQGKLFFTQLFFNK